MDAVANFALSSVAVAPSPALSGTSLTVAAGGALLFPATPFNAVVWPAGAKPSSANAEIVRVTNISGSVFTITRQQESTAARKILVGDQIAQNVTAFLLNQLASGGSQPAGDQYFSSDSEAIASLGQGQLKWEKFEGPGLMDLTDPLNPTIITAGIYALTVTVKSQTTITAAGYFDFFIHMDDSGETATAWGLSGVSPVGSNDESPATASLVWYCPAGAVVNCTVNNYDGVQSLTFTMGNGVLQRIS